MPVPWQQVLYCSTAKPQSLQANQVPLRPHGEFVVEVHGRLAECGGHPLVQRERRLQDLGTHLLRGLRRG